MTAAMIQGGTLTNDMIYAAYSNNTRFAIPTCPCLGFLGAALDGGITREMGLCHSEALGATERQSFGFPCAPESSEPATYRVMENS